MTDATTNNVEKEPEVKAAWRQLGSAWLIAFLITMFIMREAGLAMVNTWWASTIFFHVLLLLPVFLWLIWQRRDILAQLRPEPFLWGLIPLFGACALWFSGHVADVMVVQQFALIFTIQSLVLTLLGVTIVRALLFPLVYMLFLVPFGEGLIPPLQDLTAVAIVKGLNILNIPVYVDGTLLLTPTGHFTVAEACSGVRYLISTVALGALFANIAFKSWKRRLAIMVIAVAMPIIANAIRAFGIVYIAYLTDNEYAAGVDHIIYGWVFFAILTLALIFIGMSFADRPVDDPPVDLQALMKWQPDWIKSSYSLLPSVLPAFAVLLVIAVYAGYVQTRQADNAIIAFNDIEAPQGWQLIDIDDVGWKPIYLNADVEAYAHFEKDGQVVSVYRVRYNQQGSDAELIRYGNTVIAPDKIWTRTRSGSRSVSWGGENIQLSTTQLNATTNVIRDVWQVYWINDKALSSELDGKLQSVFAKIFGGNLAAASVIISAPRLVNAGDANSLADFVAGLAPVDVLLDGEGSR